MATVNAEQKLTEIQAEIARLRHEAEKTRDGITYAEGQAIVAAYNATIRALFDLESNLQGMRQGSAPAQGALRPKDRVKNSGGWAGTVLYLEGDEAIVHFDGDRADTNARYKLSELTRDAY